MPPQDDPDEEDLRIAAIDSFQDLKFEDTLHDIWSPVARELIGKTYEPTELDGALRTGLQVVRLSSVIAHCGDAWGRIRGHAYGVSLNRLSGRKQFTPGVKPSHVFDDTARGLQGRTTSRIEDEPVCLCALLGLDNTTILDLPVLSFRQKSILSSVTSKPRLVSFCRTLGLDVQETLSKCHDERMRAAFQLLDEFPPDMIFWNVPRLKKQGWRWAPSTFLSDDTRVRTRAAVKATRIDEGLLVQFQGWRLCLDREAIRSTPRNSNYVVLSVTADLPEDAHPSRRSWQHSRLPGSAKRWAQYFAANRDLALVVDEDRGVLMTVKKEVDGVVFTTFETAVQRFVLNTTIESAHVVSASGKWVWYPRWCIG